LPEDQGAGEIALLKGHLDEETRDAGRGRVGLGDFLQRLT
jgi:hypothetical protein